MFAFIRRCLPTLLLLSLLSTTYLYNYPALNACAFPAQAAPNSTYWNTFKHTAGFGPPRGRIDAPFRLLALGDPQLEGDSSLLVPEHGRFPSIASLWPEVLTAVSRKERLEVVTKHLRDLLIGDIPRILKSYRKRLDLLGNDYYLAHIYRSLHRFLKPTHVTVLGDLLGSQWISDEEFERRGWRFWNRVFKGGRRVEDEVTGGIHLGPLGQSKSWETRIFNVVGNHDIGYAGDITPERLERFERVFGKANWETRFTLPVENSTGGEFEHLEDLPELRVVVLNTLNLDTPALDPDLQSETYQFINDVIGVSRPVEDKTSGTILLTHIPLHKEHGICTDGPYFTFNDAEYGGGLKEQNHLSYDAAKGILEGLFGMSGNPDAPAQGLGRNGIVLTGHDHEGCDVYHHLPYAEDTAVRKWKAERWGNSSARFDESIPGIREVTVRSMMGEFGGKAGLLSAWYDQDKGTWLFEYSTCAVGIQHIWWAVHILDLVTIGMILAVVIGHQYSRLRGVPRRQATRLDMWLEKANAAPPPFKPRRRATTLDKWLGTANERPAPFKPRRRAATLNYWLDTANERPVDRLPSAVRVSSLENPSGRLLKRRPP